MSISQLFVDTHISNSALVNRFSERLKLKPQYVDTKLQLFERIKNHDDDPWHKGKQILFLTRNQGAFLRNCPGTRAYLCCDYQILHIGEYCTMDCAYCILQSYFHPPVLQYFVNHEALMAELDTKLRHPQIRRIGSGEFTDSLIWDAWSDLTPRLIERFAKQNRAVLELKTKTTAVAHLKDLRHNRKTILSWSLNTPRIIAGQERGTATLQARLRAAAQCRQWGYPLAFHFDPMVIYPGCEHEYRHVLSQVFKHVPAPHIVWISMGTLRFMPALKPIIQKRFSQSDIVYGELIPGLDGKMRYFKPLRISLYQAMVRSVQTVAPDLTLYLCMEDDQVWSQSFGYSPQSKGGLGTMLDESARRHCGLI